MTRAQHRYSADLKQRLVEEIEAGHVSLREAARDARTSVPMIQKWLEEYGRYQPKRDVLEVVMKSEQDQITVLKQALADAHLKLVVYDELITQANKRYKTDLKKNFGMAQLEPSVAAAPSHLRPSAAPSDARATPTTNAAPAAARGTTRKR